MTLKDSMHPFKWDLPTIEGCEMCAHYDQHIKHAIYGMDAECLITEKLKHLCAVHHIQECSLCWDTECGDNTNDRLKEARKLMEERKAENDQRNG